MDQRLQKNGWAWVRLALTTIVVAGLSTSLLSFPLFPSGRLVLEEGDVAPRDVRAPRRLTYESAIRTAEQRQLAEATVEPVYTSADGNISRQQLERSQDILDYLGSVRADSYATPSQRRAWVLAVPELSSIPLGAADGLLNLPDESWERVKLEVFNVVADAMQNGVREGFVEQARREIPSRVSFDLSVEESSVTAALAMQMIVPNTFYDETATQAAREQAREQVAPVLVTYESDEIIVREGQRVSALHMEALRAAGLQQSRTRWIDVLGYGLLVVVALVLLGLFLLRFQPSVLWQGSKLLLLSLLLVIFLLLARLMVPDRTVLRYLFPASALSMLVTATLGAPVGMTVSVLIGGAAALIGEQSLELATYFVVGGLIACMVMQRADQLSAFFRAALFVSLAHIAVIASFQLPLERIDLTELALRSLSALANGGISASMALGGLFMIGPLFDVITTFRLIELSRPDHPLLRRLLREAPGTYHHSLMVASLAEQAAERIGADPLLTRVGAYYHDVGKIVRPYFFIENQVEGFNPHEQMDPSISAEVIINHVRDGVELARRYRLPSRVAAFIPEHHGTKRVSFQYERALQLAGGDAQQVDEANFRHIGPKPHDKETALVMLADGSEAIVRARRPGTPEELAEAVRTIFRRTMESGQLEECPITMRELHLAEESFIATLKGVFHPRIRYPEPVEAPAALAQQAAEPIVPAAEKETVSR